VDEHRGQQPPVLTVGDSWSVLGAKAQQDDDVLGAVVQLKEEPDNDVENGYGPGGGGAGRALRGRGLGVQLVDGECSGWFGSILPHVPSGYSYI
jgi:hypothetical protein